MNSARGTLPKAHRSAIRAAAPLSVIWDTLRESVNTMTAAQLDKGCIERLKRQEITEGSLCLQVRIHHLAVCD